MCVPLAPNVCLKHISPFQCLSPIGSPAIDPVSTNYHPGSSVPLSGKDKFVDTPSDRYEEVALVYTRLVRQESQAAAAAIEEIQAEFGAQAALRAALIITIMKIEVQQNHWLPSVKVFNDLLQDYPEALPLTKYAIECCLQQWTAPAVKTSE